MGSDEVFPSADSRFQRITIFCEEREQLRSSTRFSTRHASATNFHAFQALHEVLKCHPEVLVGGLDARLRHLRTQGLPCLAGPFTTLDTVSTLPLNGCLFYSYHQMHPEDSARRESKPHSESWSGVRREQHQTNLGYGQVTLVDSSWTRETPEALTAAVTSNVVPAGIPLIDVSGSVYASTRQLGDAKLLFKVLNNCSWFDL
mmetsp:Transcript_10627/g.16654  ORF Transcript_10627/g.16654 Transcript_10627/m.16654 type:complete len:202 (+) Transcript_10627:222-827(+)